MSDMHIPTIKRAEFSVQAWLGSLDPVDGGDPSDPLGRKVKKVRWYAGSAEVMIPHLFGAELYESNVVYAGNNEPVFVSEDQYASGHGIWRVNADCVIVLSYHGLDGKLNLEAIAVTNKRRATRARKRQRQVNAGLMSSVTSILSPQRGRRGKSVTVVPELPPEGKDPDGD